MRSKLKGKSYNAEKPHEHEYKHEHGHEVRMANDDLRGRMSTASDVDPTARSTLLAQLIN